LLQTETLQEMSLGAVPFLQVSVHSIFFPERSKKESENKVNRFLFLNLILYTDWNFLIMAFIWSKWLK